MSSPARSRGELTISTRFELEGMRRRMNTGDPEPVVVGRDRRFELERLLGHGGMGDVYLAHDLVLGRDVALKVIAGRHRHSRPLRHRLLREARALAQVRHPNVLEVYDVDVEGSGELFVTMAYVPGQTLSRWQLDRSTRELLEVYLRAGQGVLAAHEHGIVHRDFKPGNVLIDEGTGQVVVGDFGLASAPRLEPTETGELEALGVEDERKSTSSTIAGTPGYMAPEVARGHSATFASDQYSFCVALWESLTGALPFSGPRSPGCDLPPRPAAMPRWLYRALQRGLQENPRDRFESFADLLSALDRGLRRRDRYAGAAMLGAGLAVGATLLLSNGESEEHQQSRVDCNTAAAAIDEVWNQAAEDRLRRALGSGDARAGDALSYALEVFERSAERWREAAVASCEAHEREPLSWRIAAQRSCQERYLGHFAWVLEQIERSGPKSARYIDSLLAELLWPGAQCERPRPRLAEAAQTLLDEAEFAELLHDYDRALALAAEVAENSKDLGEPCIEGLDYSLERGEALYRIGRAHGMRDHAAEALAALDQAALDALACEADELLGRVHVFEAQIHAVDLEQSEPAERALAFADVLFERLGGAGDQAHEIAKTRGFIALARQEPLEAVAWYESAIAMLGDELAVYPSKAKLHANIGAALQEHGDYVEAEAAHQKAVELVAHALGPEHPEARARRAQANFNMGLMALYRGQYARAKQRFAAIEARDSPELAIRGRYSLVATLTRDPEHIDAAVDEARRLVAVVEALPQLPPRTRAEALTIAGQVLAGVGDPLAITSLAEALPLWEQVPDAEFNHDVCMLYYARALLAAGFVEDAKRHTETLALRVDADTNEQVRAGLRELQTTLRRARRRRAAGRG